MKKMLIGAALVALATAGCHWCGNTEVVATAISPDGKNEIRLYLNPMGYEVLRGDQVVVKRTPIGMMVDGTCLAKVPVLKKVENSSRAGRVNSPFYKKASVDLAAGEAVADFETWALRLVARNDGVAYRFETKFPGRVKINAERAGVTIPCPKATCRVNFTGGFGLEETLNKTMPAADVRMDGRGQRMAYLPFVYTVGPTTVAVVESDVCDYPIWNLKRNEAEEKPEEGVKLTSLFAGWPSKTIRVGGWGGKPEDQNLASGGRWLRVKGHEDYLVETAGTRTFPWRGFILADAPAKLCEADLVWALAPASKGDFSWVKPGKVAWDWWNDWNLEGVNFKAGCNTKSYEYYIDFAARTGVEYVIFDEGWSEKLNIWKYHPDVNVPHLIDYANRRGVGIILWMAWGQIAGDEEHVASYFSKLGAKGFKVDFMDRGDADVERFLWKFAEVCARHHMLLDYHGAHHPTGMSRVWPNVLNYEGIHGLECMKWFKNKDDFMENDIKAFYCRMTAGPMDYTPGAMLNYPIGQYKGSNHAPGSVGTRCHQMALMALYEAPLQMLCDSPTNYEKNMESFAFMATTPVTWDDTVGLGGTPETYAMAARRKGDAWYAAAISNADARDVTLDTAAFLKDGTWQAEIFRDAADAAVSPMKYVHERRTVKAGEKLAFHLAPGGGFVVRFMK